MSYITTIKCMCIEGKLLPAIPNPDKSVDDYPDCPDCNGSGYVDVDGRWVNQGSVFASERRGRKITLRSFCMKHNLCPVTVNKVERGIKPATKKIRRAYAKMITQ